MNASDSYKIMIRKSDCYILMKEYELAFNIATKCIDIQPLSIKAYLNGGNAAMELQKYSSAQQMFEKAKQLAQHNPNSAENIKLLQTEMPITELISPPRML